MAGFVIPEDELRQQADKDRITHLSSGVAIVQGGKVLAVRRVPDDFPGGMFELPGGGIDPGETFEVAASREVLEETGLTVTSILAMFPSFDYSTPKKPKVRQFNFLVEANGEVKLSNEHDLFKWIGEADIPRLATTGPMAECFYNALAVASEI